MNSGELYEAFRNDVVDTEVPQLWSDSEVWRYMDDAYRMFARLTGGFPDTSSPLTVVDIITGEKSADVSPLILKFRRAELVSSGKKLEIVNETDMLLTTRADYGSLRTLYQNRQPGPVSYVVVGAERNRLRGVVAWVQIPELDDQAQFSVLRLPLVRIVGENQEFDDLGEEHHEHLLLWMKHRAYGKQDAETFDRGKSQGYKSAFEEYCEGTRLEYEKYKTKVRVVSYGGI